MDMGPVQLIVYGFDKPTFSGGIAAELKRLREQDIVRVVDALVVHKNAQGEIDTLQVTDLTPDESAELGAVVGALIGLGVAGEKGMETGAALGAIDIADRGGHVLDPDEWDVLDSIPEDSAAAIVLLEHRWAIPLRDSILAEGGMALGDVWLHPRDLVAAGIVAAEEVQREEARRAAG
jgi:uncharacterized membrane protein